MPVFVIDSPERTRGWESVVGGRASEGCPGPTGRQRTEEAGTPRKWAMMSSGAVNCGWHTYKRGHFNQKPKHGS